VFVFALPLKPAAVARDFRGVLDRFGETLRSIANSSDSRFVAYVATNDPEMVRDRFSYVWLRVVTVTGNRPTGGPYAPFNPGNADKKSKLIAIGRALRQDFRGPLQVMPLDADDLVDTDLVKYARGAGESDMLIRHGYVWCPPSNELTLTRAYHRRSGSRCLFRLMPADLPQTLDDFHCTFTRLVWSQDKKTIVSLGRSVRLVKWPAAMYRTGNPESITSDYQTAEYKRRQRLKQARTTRVSRQVDSLMWRIYNVLTRRQLRDLKITRPILGRFGITDPACDLCES